MLWAELLCADVLAYGGECVGGLCVVDVGLEGTEWVEKEGCGGLRNFGKGTMEGGGCVPSSPVGK